MILDAQLLFSDAQAITASAGSTNQVDLGPLKSTIRDIGVGQDLYAVVVCDVAMTDAGSDSTVTVTLETDNDSAFGSPTTAVQTLGVFAALAAVGTRLVAKLQPEKILEQYLRVYYTVTGGNLTTGSFTAFLTMDIAAFRAYADNITISG